jgi:hypothetical protein
MTPQEQSYRTIPLTQGQFAIVDKQDYDAISVFKWCAHWVPSSKCYRAMRRSADDVIVYMHRQILGLEKGDPRIVDYINLDQLDNRKHNLRFATKASNAWNCGKRPQNTSGYKGVSWDKSRSQWVAQVKANNIQYSIGRFSTPEAAYFAYCEAVKGLHGEFARTK